MEEGGARMKTESIVALLLRFFSCSLFQKDRINWVIKLVAK
jgi:hypothetical protein